MDHIPKIPGKTAPRIIADLKSYITTEDGPNPFRDPPTSYLTHNFNPPINNALRCEHIFTTKRDQTHVEEPINGFPPIPLKKASGICQHCRWHVEVSIAAKADSWSPCPNPDFPLHFFVLSEPTQIDQDSRRQVRYVWACRGCEAKLEIVYRPPRLELGYFHLLIDSGNLRERYEKARIQDPDRQSLQQQPGIKVLEALSSYLSESLTPTRGDSSVPADNKRFMTSFGNDCDSLLIWLGFVKKNTITENGKTIEPAVWKLPVAPACNPFIESSRNILEDVMEELHAKIRSYPEHEQKTLKHPPPYPTSLNQPLELILECRNYSRVENRLRKADLGSEEYYLGLGAVSDFSDSLIQFCYQQQRLHRPDASSYFFDCLAALAQKRDSEDLTLTATVSVSDGYTSTEEVLQAYRYLGFKPDEVINLHDDQILGSFNSRLDNSSRHQESELREKLKIVGRSRGSENLVSAAENDFQTPDQAIKWLDPTYDGSVHMPDENIIAIAASKSAERPEHAELCRKALKIIGYARNSEQLTAWSSASADPKSVRETAISDALEFFRITDRNNFDMEVLSLMIDDWGGDAPRHYNVLLEMRKEQESIIGPAAYEKPVGLENMGNTCYLNCLLQFLYTVKPVRDLILDFDQHKLDTTSPSFRPKQVDFVPVPRTETEQSQQFVTELRDLFRDMSTNPHSAVRPTWDLAKFALKRSAMPTLARRSTLGGDMASLKSPIGTQAPPLPESSIVGSSPVRRGTSASASEITLIDSVEPTPTTESDSEMKMDDLVEKDARVALDSPEQLPKAMEGDDESVPLLSSPSKETSPDKPPPVPPRPALTIGPLTKQEAAGSGSKEESSKREAEEAAQQQDVEEAMSNVLWKVQCAVEDTITTASGSTTNVVNQLFYGRYLWKYLDTKTEDSDEVFSTINISLLQKPKSISAGLDNYFAIDDLTLDNITTRRYCTITNIPPMFQVYLQRQEFDYSRGDTVIVKHHIQLEEVIYMDRYMTLKDELLHERRIQAWKLDARLKDLYDSQTRLSRTNTALEGPDLLDASWQFVERHSESIGSEDSSLAEDLKAEASTRRTRVSATAQRIKQLEDKREALFAPYRKHAYRLAAVFVHRGQGGSLGGHYWIYIYDFKETKWRRYEDREVRDVENAEEEIYSQKDPERDGAPYFVVYVREEAKDEIVDTLCRIKPVEDSNDGPNGEADSEMLEPIESIEGAPQESHTMQE